MPYFVYRAKQGPEKIVQGSLEAVSEAAVIEKLYQMGYTPVSVHLADKSAQGGLSAPAVFTKISPKMLPKLISFSRHLAALIKAGVPVLRAIHILSEQEPKPAFRAVLVSFEEEVKKGKSFSQAAASFPEIFPRMYIAMAQAGEASGNLHEALDRVSKYLKRQQELIGKLKRALIYPCFLIGAGFLSVIFILSFAVPKFAKVFDQMGKELPWPTRFVMSVGDAIQHGWYWILFALVLIFILLPKITQKIFGDSFWDTFILRVPWFGGLTMKADLSRFLRSLDLCLSSGLVFLDALKASIPTIENSVTRRTFMEISLKVEKGKSFSAALKEESLFSAFTSQFILIGEESGRINEVVLEMAENYESEIDDQMTYLTTLLEPALILLIGGIVAFIVFAMLLPIFEINSSF